MKRFFAFLSALALLLSLAACIPGQEPPATDPTEPTHIHSYDENGQCTGCDSKVSIGLEYVLSNDNTAYSVSGIGTCTDSHIVIPSVYEGKPVSSIGYAAFQNCTGLTEITIPDSITYIGLGAFTNCIGLTCVTIPEGVTHIYDHAFAYCTNLTNITIPDSVISIGSRVFDGCNSLTYNEYDNACYLGNVTNPYLALICSKSNDITDCTIHPNTKIISGFAFFNCTGLIGITIPDSVTYIALAAFSGCTGLTYITVDSGNSVYHSAGNCLMETASKTLVAGCNTSVIPVDGSVTDIGDAAFFYCNRLTEITIPDGVMRIGREAFSYCIGLTKITIPDSVTHIDSAAFCYCAGLTDITFTGTMAQWKAIEKGASWNDYAGEYTVYCTDGNLSKADS